MTNKFYNYCKKIGGIISVLFMFAPVFILSNYSTISYPIFWLVVSIFYNIFMYSIIIKLNYIKDAKERYFKYVKNIDDTIPSLKLTDKEKIDNMENFIKDIFDEIEK